MGTNPHATYTRLVAVIGLPGSGAAASGRANGLVRPARTPLAMTTISSEFVHGHDGCQAEYSGEGQRNQYGDQPQGQADVLQHDAPGPVRWAGPPALRASAA